MPEKRSAWDTLAGYLDSISRFPLELNAVIASSGLPQPRAGPRIRLSSMKYSLPGILDDANLLYHPYELARMVREGAKSFSLVHHFIFSPFGMNSFNSAALLGLLHDRAFIIGPAQLPHRFYEDDMKLYSRNGFMTGPSAFRGLEIMNQLFRTSLRLGFLRTLDACDCLVVVNREAKNLYSHFISAKKIQVIPTGVFVQKFVREGERQRNKTVLMIGNLIFRKGIHVAIQAMKSVLAAVPDAELNIVGEGPACLQLQQLSKQLGVDHKVHFIGRVSNESLTDLCSTASVFCHASFSEAFSYTIVEAMGAGLPVVCTDIPGSSGMVDDGLNGFNVAPGDDVALADAIVRVLSDPALVQEMGRNGQNRATEYGWDVVAKKYYSLYSKLAT